MVRRRRDQENAAQHGEIFGRWYTFYVYVCVITRGWNCVRFDPKLRRAMRGRRLACTHSVRIHLYTWKCAPAQHIGPFRVHVRDLGHTTTPTAGVGKLHFCAFARRTHQLNKLRAHTAVYVLYILYTVGVHALASGCTWTSAITHT